MGSSNTILKMTPEFPIWPKSKMAAKIRARIWVYVKSHPTQSSEMSNSMFSGSVSSNIVLEMTYENSKWLKFNMADYNTI